MFRHQTEKFVFGGAAVQKTRNVDSIAMESTGVYWIAPHEVLEAESFQILLVDTSVGPRTRVRLENGSNRS